MAKIRRTKEAVRLNEEADQRSKEAAYRVIDNELLPAVVDCLRRGLMVVLIGATGSGKSVLARKALPSAVLVTGLDGAPEKVSGMNGDLIAEELYGVPTDQSIQYRDEALAHGHRVIFTGQAWQDVDTHLAGLDEANYKVFDLNRVWEKYGRDYFVRNPIPEAVAAN